MHNLKLSFFFIAILFIVQDGFCIDHRGAWIDIPTASFVSSREGKIENIENLIREYHAINKTSLALISQRISKLEEIHQEIIKMIQVVTPAIKNKVQQLDSLVQKKTWYLTQVQSIYKNPEPYKDFLDFRGSIVSAPLILANHVRFDFKLPGYWGLAWLEVLDPCHRFLTTHYLKWQEENSNVPFFLWLEGREISSDVIQVYFLNDIELRQYQVEIENGLFVSGVNKKKINYEKPDQEYIFVMTLDKKLIVIEGNKTIRHSSISHGRPVLGAGALRIRDGKLVYIDVESGHYQSTPEALWQVIQALDKQGAHLDYNTMRVKYYNNGQLTRENGYTFMQKYRGTTPEKLTPQFLEGLRSFKIS